MTNNKAQSLSFTNKLMSGLSALKQPFLAIAFGLVVGAIVILAMGESPVVVYGEMFEKSFFSSYYLLQTLSRATPIIICAMATAMAWRAGYINIGVEGQMVVGGFVSAVSAIYIPGPAFIILPLSLALGVIAGGLYATIASYLYYKFGVSMVICTLMLNYVANNITSYFVSHPLQDQSGDGLALQTILIPEGMHFLKFDKMASINVSFVLAIFITIAFLLYSKRTVLGYESRMGGLNPYFAEYGGIKGVKTLLITMFLSGGIAALAGTGDIFGIKYRYIDAMLSSPSYAWTGLMAALIADLHPVGMFFAAIFLAGLQVGGQSIQRTADIPIEMATIIQCCITLFVSVKLVIKFVKKKKADKGTAESAQSAQGGNK